MHPDEQAIRDVVQTWLKASSRGDLDQVLGLMSDDVIFHTVGREPFGKEAFAAAMRASAGQVRAEGSADVQEVLVCGDMAYCRVHLEITLSAPGGVERKRLSGHSLSVLRKQGGRWVIARDANFVAPVQEGAQTVTTQLMFEGRAEEAMTLYVSLFKRSEVKRLERYGPGEPGPEGSVKRAEVTLAGHRLACIDGPVRHAFTFTPSISLFVDCGGEEFDRAFAELSGGGSVLMPPGNYGFSTRFAWINDRFGVSWQLNLR
jgi:uncharacterized protein (TIGR02246 family)